REHRSHLSALLSIITSTSTRIWAPSTGVRKLRLTDLSAGWMTTILKRPVFFRWFRLRQLPLFKQQRPLSPPIVAFLIGSSPFVRWIRVRPRPPHPRIHLSLVHATVILAD